MHVVVFRKKHFLLYFLHQSAVRVRDGMTMKKAYSPHSKSVFITSQHHMIASMDSQNIAKCSKHSHQKEKEVLRFSISLSLRASYRRYSPIFRVLFLIARLVISGSSSRSLSDMMNHQHGSSSQSSGIIMLMKSSTFSITIWEKRVCGASSHFVRKIAS